MTFGELIYIVKAIILAGGPVLSGLIGGLIAMWFCSKLSKFIPEVYNSKKREDIVKENKTRVTMANTLFLVSVFGGLALFKYGYFAQSDWYGFALMAGFAFTSPAIFLVLSTIGINKQRVAEAFFAYSVNQNLPLAILYPFFVIGVFCLVVGFVGMFE